MEEHRVLAREVIVGELVEVGLSVRSRRSKEYFWYGWPFQRRDGMFSLGLQLFIRCTFLIHALQKPLA